MALVEAIVLGLLQGLTEFIPVSSSGHLVLAEKLFQLEISGFVFDAVLNIGTLAALVIYFRHDLAELLRSLYRGGQNRRLALLLAWATLPALLAGILVQDLTATRLRSTYVVAAALALVGLAMLLVEQLTKSERGLKAVRLADSTIIGLAQVLAFIPGVSRSGATITAGLARGLERSAAARFSFLLSLPVLGGGTLKVLLDQGSWRQVSDNPSLFLAGIAAAFVSGYLAIAWLLKYLSIHRLSLFAYYRLILAIIIIIVATV